MEVLLSNNCLSLTGMLNPSLGYSLQKRRSKKGKVRFFSLRSRFGAPPDGHWRFIVLCAELAKNQLHISDIRVQADEMRDALWEAGHFIASQNLRKPIYDARDVLNLKTTFGL